MGFLRILLRFAKWGPASDAFPSDALSSKATESHEKPPKRPKRLKRPTRGVRAGLRCLELYFPVQIWHCQGVGAKIFFLPKHACIWGSYVSFYDSSNEGRPRMPFHRMPCPRKPRQATRSHRRDRRDWRDQGVIHGIMHNKIHGIMHDKMHDIWYKETYKLANSVYFIWVDVKLFR